MNMTKYKTTHFITLTNSRYVNLALFCFHLGLNLIVLLASETQALSNSAIEPTMLSKGFVHVFGTTESIENEMYLCIHTTLAKIEN